jgi:hypothetical protein
MDGVLAARAAGIVWWRTAHHEKQAITKLPVPGKTGFLGFLSSGVAEWSFRGVSEQNNRLQF